MRIKPRIQRITTTNGVIFYLCSSAILNEGRRYIYAGAGITPEAAYKRWSTDWYVMLDFNETQLNRKVSDARNN